MGSRRKVVAGTMLLMTFSLVITECHTTAITFPQESSENKRETLILQREQQLHMREQALRDREQQITQREKEVSEREAHLVAEMKKKHEAEAAAAALAQQSIIDRLGAEGAKLPKDDLNEFFTGLSGFSLDMMQRLAKSETNVAFSPLTTWVLLALMSEGAQGSTLQELETTLALPKDKNVTYRGFESIRSDIMQIMKGNSLINLGSAAFTSPRLTLKDEFKRIAEVCYNTTIQNVEFRNRSAAATVINKWVDDLTMGNIKGIVHPDDLDRAELVLTSALYFRGSWKDAFNESLTRREPFMDDSGARVAEVDMMYQVGRFRLSFIEGLKAIALELPYSSERNSMLLLLPRRGSTLTDLLSNMASYTEPLVPSIMKKLEEDQIADTEDEDTHVYLPRFELNSKLKLVDLLKKMGIKKLFESRADLRGVSTSNLYVSNLIHKAAISVTEKGTTASASSAAVLHNYSLPSTFKANRPFLFMIIQRATNAILFAGKVGNPSPSVQTRTY
ncbi:serine protease inhibitor-like [Neocloeon triangulifer]|uniref:serine protease inhibitor-like n=1 Tax=Neocloeon triangulifer TaxID=2078957 RepID=UPI00286F3156|nr:serine protease inhibitor-like [Neocloeon triangulifer]